MTKRGVWSLSCWWTLPPAAFLITLFTLVISQQTPHPHLVLYRTTDHPNKTPIQEKWSSSKRFFSTSETAAEFQSMAGLIMHLTHTSDRQTANISERWNLISKSNLFGFVWASRLLLWLTEHYLTTAVLCSYKWLPLKRWVACNIAVNSQKTSLCKHKNAPKLIFFGVCQLPVHRYAGNKSTHRRDKGQMASYQTLHTKFKWYNHFIFELLPSVSVKIQAFTCEHVKTSSNTNHYAFLFWSVIFI